jgi:RimJ/RimL family protein N-acetyltransferase
MMQCVLQGKHIILEQLSESSREHLRSVAQDKEIWTFNGTSGFGDQFDFWYDKALKSAELGSHLPFLVRRKSDNAIIGSTRFYDIEAEHRRLKIGFTWYIPKVWGTFVNPECKYLLLRHAFEEMEMNRVEFVTDARNLRSRAAIKKLGATEEGILRQHMILGSGLLRDTVVFSIIQPEWPSVKSKLDERLQEFPERI